MANIGFSRNERAYVQLETTYGVIPNTSGTATLAGSNAFRFKKLQLNPAVEPLTREDKTGSRTVDKAIPGRRQASWSMNQDLAANGVPGVVPDSDPFLVAAMGNPGVVKAGTATITAATAATPIVCTAANSFVNGDAVTIAGATGPGAAGPNGSGLNGTFIVIAVSGTGFTLLGSVGTGTLAGTPVASRVAVVYKLSDTLIPTMDIWDFRTPSTLQQRVAWGCNVKTFKFTLNQKIADVSFSGMAGWVLDSKSVADSSADATALGGLTTFPAEPAVPVTNGGIIPGYQGRLVANGISLIRVNAMEVSGDTGGTLPTEYFTSQYPAPPEGDARKISITADIDDDDSVGIQALYEAALTMTSIDLVAQIGIVPGSIFLIYIRGLQLAVPNLDDGSRRWQLKFGESMAHGSSLTALDDITIWVM